MRRKELARSSRAARCRCARSPPWWALTHSRALARFAQLGERAKLRLSDYRRETLEDAQQRLEAEGHHNSSS